MQCVFWGNYLLCPLKYCRLLSGDIACIMLPLTEELQANKLREKCERVIFDRVSQRFRDGKESESVIDLYYYLHLSEMHSVTRVLDFCIPVASEFTASERQEGMKQYQISTELRLKIVEFAEQRHEIRAQDELDLIEQYKSQGYKQIDKGNINHKYTLSQFVSYYYVQVRVSAIYYTSRVNHVDKPEAFRRHLRGLRLACLHFPDDNDLISQAVKKVREDMNDTEWKVQFQHQHYLLPQKIKSYLQLGRCVVVVEF